VQDDGAVPGALAELAADGAEPVPADALAVADVAAGVLAGVVLAAAPPGDAADPDDAAAQPAIGAATARTTSADAAEAADRRVRAARGRGARGSGDSYV
jgi:hypothetical protein